MLAVASRENDMVYRCFYFLNFFQHTFFGVRQPTFSKTFYMSCPLKMKGKNKFAAI